jgi:hypothetical protein
MPRRRYSSPALKNTGRHLEAFLFTVLGIFQCIRFVLRQVPVLSRRVQRCVANAAAWSCFMMGAAVLFPYSAHVEQQLNEIQRQSHRVTFDGFQNTRMALTLARTASHKVR